MSWANAGDSDAFAAVYCSDLTRAARTAEIAFGERGIPIVRDARLRECDYGALTRHPAADIEAMRASCIALPFPGGESYEQCVARVSAWLADAGAAHPGGHVLVIGHRATFYALEHLLRGAPLDRVITAPWSWQPGWTYSEVEALSRALCAISDRCRRPRTEQSVQTIAIRSAGVRSRTSCSLP